MSLAGAFSNPSNKEQQAVKEAIVQFSKAGDSGNIAQLGQLTSP